MITVIAQVKHTDEQGNMTSGYTIAANDLEAQIAEVRERIQTAKDQARKATRLGLRLAAKDARRSRKVFEAELEALTAQAVSA